MLQHVHAGTGDAVLDRTLDLFASLAAALPLLEAGAAGVNVRIQLFVDDASTMHQMVVLADTILAAVLGSVFGLFSGSIIAPSVVVGRIMAGRRDDGVVMADDGGWSGLLRQANTGIVRVRVNNAAVDNLEGVRC